MNFFMQFGARLLLLKTYEMSSNPFEDNEDIRNLCSLLLESEGFSVETCLNGQEALLSLDRDQTPCLILLDMLMPVMNGREFMTEFAKRPLTIVPIPVYLVSATAQKGDGHEMGCLGFIKKPFNIETLLSIVNNHCKSNSSRMAG
jgi:CheY-like chemotaxis protein